MEELKPCPFCGGTEFFITTGTEDREGFPANITCDQCGCNGPWTYIKNRNDLDDIYIIAKRTRWNDRPITQQLKAEIAKCANWIDGYKSSLDSAKVNIVYRLRQLSAATTKPESGNPASEKLPDDIKEKFKRFVDEQVSLPSTFADVVNEHFWDLI